MVARLTRILIPAILVAGLFAPPANAGRLSCLWAMATAARDPESTEAKYTSFGYASEMKPALPKTFRLLLWNIYKGKREGLLEDFSAIASDVDLAILQEAIDEPSFTSEISARQPSLAWHMVNAFTMMHSHSTGVATGSAAEFLSTRAFTSVGSEPFLKTPKSILLSEHRLEGSKENLLVANMHALNFVRRANFESNVDQLIAAIADHKGPIIVAGDFNTWSGARLQYLKQALAAKGVAQVPMERTSKFGLVLDHVFVRDLKIVEARLLSGIKTSDHKPILVELEAGKD